MESEKLIKVFEAFVKKDSESFHRVAAELIEDENRKKHHLLARRLKQIMSENGISANVTATRQIPPVPRENEKGFRLLDVKKMYLNWEDVVLSQEVKDALNQVVLELEKEEVLATYGLKPKRKLLFYGPPGTGKTQTAKVLSSVVGYPLVLVRFDSVVSSYLGETASNLRRIFDYIESGKWVVLFDEFDIIGKQRDDPSEHGEIKRVVNNFMLMIENYEGDSVIVASTNHPHLLDDGVWRRFDAVVQFDLPNKERRKKIFDKYLRVLKKGEIDMAEILQKSEKFSGSDIEQTCVEALKKTILQGKDRLDHQTLMGALVKQRKRLAGKGVAKYG